MKENRFLTLRSQGQIPVGHMVMEFTTRGMAQILDAVSVDFVLIDMEHSPHTVGDVADFIAWLQATPITPIVRVPRGERELISRVLDAGALGVMVPDVANPEMAQAVVAAVKYPPMGQRRVALGNALTRFRTVVPDEFLEFSNRNTVVVCQIESEEGLANVSRIASTPGVDVLWVGQFDLSLALGIPGQYHQPRFRDALRRIVEAAREHGRTAGIQASTVSQAEEWLNLGFTAISYANDFTVYQRALVEHLGRVRDFTQGR